MAPKVTTVAIEDIEDSLLILELKEGLHDEIVFILKNLMAAFLEDDTKDLQSYLEDVQERNLELYVLIGCLDENFRTSFCGD